MSFNSDRQSEFSAGRGNVRFIITFKDVLKVATGGMGDKAGCGPFIQEKSMKTKNSGFTLIELVVVIVILGILASQAIPRFANLTDQANLAVAEGAVGAFLSQAVISLGENSGVAQSFATISGLVELSGDAAGGAWGGDCVGTNQVTFTLGGQTASANISTNLCSG